jgi:hypothetical protein
MTLTLNLTQEVVEDIAALLPDEYPAEDTALSERGFLMATEGTRQVWDTPEEDQGWAHL